MILLHVEGSGLTSLIMLLVLLAIGIIYLKLCSMVGNYAEKRGHSYWLFYLIALFCNPFVGYIIAVLAGDNRD